VPGCAPRHPLCHPQGGEGIWVGVRGG
jgi:hypothetical protein